MAVNLQGKKWAKTDSVEAVEKYNSLVDDLENTLNQHEEDISGKLDAGLFYVSHNPDGTQKDTGGTAAQWLDIVGETITRVDDYTFTVTNNYAGTLSAHRALKINDTSFTHVESSTYDTGTNLTTVVTTDIIPDPITSISYSFIDELSTVDINAIVPNQVIELPLPQNEWPHSGYLNQNYAEYMVGHHFDISKYLSSLHRDIRVKVKYGLVTSSIYDNYDPGSIVIDAHKYNSDSAWDSVTFYHVYVTGTTGTITTPGELYCKTATSEVQIDADHDYTWVSVEAKDGVTYVVALAQDTNGIYLFKSTDNGATWTKITVYDGTTTVSRPALAVDSNGNSYVFYDDYDGVYHYLKQAKVDSLNSVTVITIVQDTSYIYPTGAACNSNDTIACTVYGAYNGIYYSKDGGTTYSFTDNGMYWTTGYYTAIHNLKAYEDKFYFVHRPYSAYGNELLVFSDDLSLIRKIPIPFKTVSYSYPLFSVLDGQVVYVNSNADSTGFKVVIIFDDFSVSPVLELVTTEDVIAPPVNLSGTTYSDSYIGIIVRDANGNSKRRRVQFKYASTSTWDINAVSNINGARHRSASATVSMADKYFNREYIIDLGTLVRRKSINTSDTVGISAYSDPNSIYTSGIIVY